MKISTDCIYPTPRDEADYIKDYDKDFNLKIDRHPNSSCPAGGELTVIGDPYEIKKYFQGMNWDDWYFEWSEYPDEFEKAFKIVTGKDDKAIEEFKASEEYWD